MNKLPENFELERYGLQVRLVQEKDAEFIVKLRTDESLGQYIHATSTDVNKQIEWIKEYKTREQNGADYYFIYSMDGKPIGVNRIYNIKDDSATTGSWVCVKDINPAYSIITMLIVREILFEMLNISVNIFEVNKQNTRVLKIHQMMGAEMIHEDDINFYFKQTSIDFVDNRNRMVKLLGLKK